MEDEDFGKVKNYALKLLSLRPRSVREMENKLSSYLARKKYPAGFLEKLIAELTRLNFLNDLEFARWWAEQRGRANIKGKTFIKKELQSKGIDREVIAEVLSALGTEDEYEKALQLAGKKFSKLALDRQSEQKLGRYLQNRGFSYDVVRKVIDSLSQRG
ncbi:MAG: regulatory protein RecX, regulatory protein [Candidatus Gottesmanbacteria bacterium GW2011_GWA2_43_14]|uniref:Regulatory protein RecX n=1 Tax=Candidatus Gottesmanbacteria bacterium GW2011_GWA2_43_14 TaxID=1618443 RepID=A0A0G1DDS9_9BACT|nr:MAG: regulatory protein RecX, regulatory protein [Candidatus Gottesmanbacteria bacterium GW2011_GWA2_43_14]